MYIKDVTIEGFKSYARRVTVPDFDPRFNAITGLNGSGKSNILDSICFVLGITDLHQVRAESVQDLVYKKGQAGVTEAAVCITFDNSDKSRSPVGYDDKDSITVTRQVVIGGRNKYRINGRQVTTTQVQEFFRGVQLNVNNPHFLIMQGRITQVLNMRPPEILAMLEEVAGTRMYEEKRIRAYQTFEKKTQKLKEFEEVMSTELQPTMERLRNDRNKLLQYSKANEDLVALERFCIAFDLTSIEEKLTRNQNLLKELENRRQQIEEEMVSVDRSLKEIEHQRQQLKQKIERKHGQGLSRLQEALNSSQIQVSQFQAEMKIKLQDRDSTLKEIQKITEELKSLDDQMVLSTVQRAQEKFEIAKTQEQDFSEELQELKREFMQFTANNQGPSKNLLLEKLEDLKIEQLNITSKLKESELKCSTLESRLLNLTQEALESAQEELRIGQDSLKHLTEKLKDLNFDEERLRQLDDNCKEKQEILASAKEKSATFSSRLADLKSLYEDIITGLDPRSVKGFVGELFKVKQKEAMKALEITAGAALKYLVVDTAETGKRILQNPRLRQKITILPIDQMKSATLNPTIQEAANQHFASKAAPAIDLLDYNPELHEAINHVFGKVFICKDKETAKAMAFHPSIQTRCVSLDGNDYRPQGLLTAGYRQSGSSLLESFQGVKSAAKEVKKSQKVLEEAQSELDVYSQHFDQFKECKLDFQAQEAVVESMKLRVQEETDRFNGLKGSLQGELESATRLVSNLKTKELQLQEKREELENHVACFDGHEAEYTAYVKQKLKELEMAHKQAERDLSIAEKDLQTVNASKEDLQSHATKFQVQLESLKEDVEKLNQEIAAGENKTQKAEQHLKQSQEAIEKDKKKYEHIIFKQNELVSKKDTIEEKAKNIRTEKRNIHAKEGRIKLETVEASNHVEKLMKVSNWIRSRLTVLQDYAWLTVERVNFGVRGSEFDWALHDPQQRMKEYKNAKSIISSLKQCVNPNVVQQYENVKSEYNELKAKHSTVLKDRENIEQAILEMDSKKSESIRTIWEKVNQEFGSIFGTLLPGSDAKLEPPEGCSYLDGLEVKVALGGTWKQSLLELSGGQRSLLALSLILAILLFKPAPFYLLDEIDSALDLSHTQNIGQMIRRFFPQSQFIIVSLKEGMFNNANVIFRTKFSEGVSTVSRNLP